MPLRLLSLRWAANMPLTNAQKQKDLRARRKAKLERLAVLEGAMRWIMDYSNDAHIVAAARKALGDVG